ncbi:Carboxylate-amine ligase YbdK [Gimesia alba]|uniref:Putative glutamate--cysteine ligase 2 n=1 Tax=Gimesia alba TaxID=2527973 RepID=A0A517RA23_9PLAN|nr:YbdK family carboxylate-amine ligase [Gimesia alba]QDT40742.1 Carboxylate-amine ligase YbdK [Gimesia alba]
MGTISFARNDYPTLGVELELQLVDAETFALSNSITDLLAGLSEEMQKSVKPELMQSYLEINTGVCRTVGDVRRDLTAKLKAVTEVTDKLGLKLFWAATHPFSSWRDQQITVNERYYELVDLMQDVARRLVTFGLHIHVGVDSGDKAVMVCDRMLRYLPLLLSLSSNSPFWEGRNTGLHSNRSKIMEGLPTAGLPPTMRNWSEYTWLINHLISTGFINTIREIWWDIRPHHNFGTVEIRVCDMPANLEQVLSLTAFVQCLVKCISDEIDEGAYQLQHHPMMVQQNKWRATRYGIDASLVNSDSYQLYSVIDSTKHLVDLVAPMSERLECTDELNRIYDLIHHSGAKRQLEIMEATNDKREVVKQMIEENNIF